MNYGFISLHNKTYMKAKQTLEFCHNCVGSVAIHFKAILHTITLKFLTKKQLHPSNIFFKNSFKSAPTSGGFIIYNSKVNTPQ